MLPPWPGWDGLHPLIIHFPIALLMVAPLFVALAVVAPKRSAGFSLAGFLLLAMGTLSTFVAVSTGLAAGELADHTDAINAVISRHEELAETTATVFAALTVLYAALLFVAPRIRRLSTPAFARAGNAVFVVLLLADCLLLVNTAHQGGRLVHQLGVRAIMPAIIAPSRAESPSGDPAVREATAERPQKPATGPDER